MDDISTIITRSITGKISRSERAELERWLNASPENARKYHELLNAGDLSQLYRIYDSIDEKRAWRRFKEHHVETHRGRVVRRVLQFAAAAAVVLCLALPLGTYLINDNQEPDMEVQTAMKRSQKAGKQKAVLTFPDGESTILLTRTDISHESLMSKIINRITGSGGNDKNTLSTYPDTEYWITLEDGTLVHLNGNTRLTYPSHFDGNSRTVSLDGEAYFQVAHSDNKTFRIKTPHGEITDYGTSFNVNTRINSGTEVVLVEGKVGLRSGRNDEVLLTPGQLAHISGPDHKVSVENVDVQPFVAWNKGNFTFDNCPLEKLMEVISHWYGLKVRYESDDIRRMHFTGDIDRYESALPVLKAIEAATMDLKIEQNGNEFVLMRK